jgi:DMSO reductase family type II enzyme chaperone
MEQATRGAAERHLEEKTMSGAPTAERRVEWALARAQVYRLLAHAFFQPDSPLNKTKSSRRLLSDGRAALVALPGTAPLVKRLDAVSEGLRSTSRRELARQYVALFSHGWEGASLPYETEYTTPHAFQKQTQLADVAGFYRAFGLQWETQGHERPDHLSLELEFMYYLALKEAHALAQSVEEGVAVCSDAQKLFLSDHLGRWLGVFRRALAGRAPEGLYTRLARLVEDYVAWDSRQQGVKPSLLRAAPARGEPLEDGGCPYSDAVCPAAPVGQGEGR